MTPRYVDSIPASASDASPLTDWLLVPSAGMHLKLDSDPLRGRA